MRNPNTVRKTTADVNKIEQWLLSKNESRDLCDIPPAELNNYLAHFFMTATKQNGEEYEPDTLKSIQCSINRFLAGKGSTVNIVEDRVQTFPRCVGFKKKNVKTTRQGEQGEESRSLHTG